jgi:hypothetical protein
MPTAMLAGFFIVFFEKNLKYLHFFEVYSMIAMFTEETWTFSHFSVKLDSSTSLTNS